MTKLVEDEELRRLRAVVEGSQPFAESGLWERIAALDQREFMKLDARTRLAAGYYVAGRRRHEQLPSRSRLRRLPARRRARAQVTGAATVPLTPGIFFPRARAAAFTVAVSLPFGENIGLAPQAQRQSSLISSQASGIQL